MTLARANTRVFMATAFVALALATTACDLGGTRGQGEVTTETRQTDAFSRIEAGEGINVSVAIGTAASLEVRAQGNILPIIVTEVSDETLRIHGSSSYSTSEKVEVILATPQLDGFVLSGGSRGSVDGLSSEAFDVELTGGSVLTASGTANTVSLDVNGGSVAEMEALEAGTISVDVSGGSRAEVRATDLVRGSATGGSKVSVFGDADVRVDTTDGSQVDQR